MCLHVFCCSEVSQESGPGGLGVCVCVSSRETFWAGATQYQLVGLHTGILYTSLCVDTQCASNSITSTHLKKKENKSVPLLLCPQTGLRLWFCSLE